MYCTDTARGLEPLVLPSTHSDCPSGTGSSRDCRHIVFVYRTRPRKGAGGQGLGLTEPKPPGCGSRVKPFPTAPWPECRSLSRPLLSSPGLASLLDWTRGRIARPDQVLPGDRSLYPSGSRERLPGTRQTLEPARSGCGGHAAGQPRAHGIDLGWRVNRSRGAGSPERRPASGPRPWERRGCGAEDHWRRRAAAAVRAGDRSSAQAAPVPAPPEPPPACAPDG